EHGAIHFVQRLHFNAKLFRVVDHGSEFVHDKLPPVQTATLLFEKNWTRRCQFDQDCGWQHDERAADGSEDAGQQDIQDAAHKHHCFICRCRAEGQQRETIEFVQFHACYRMRKKVQNNSGSHAQFFAKQESIREIIETLAVDHENEFIDSASFEKRTRFVSPENTN